MSNPLHAAYYADAACHETVDVVENVQVARDTYRIRLACPAIARAIVPGQFVMLKLIDRDDPLLARPLAMYDVACDAHGAPMFVDIVYLVLGRMTRRLVDVHSGSKLAMWGPLGNGFAPQRAEELIMVAGGIGQTPMLALAKESLGQMSYGNPPRLAMKASRVTFCYGGRTAAYLSCLEEFRATGLTLKLSTDDGTLGHHGLVTELFRETLGESEAGLRRVVCCGPERMMEAVAELCIAAKVPCEVSLETPMACGIGICFSCVARVRDADGNWDYKRTCVEGPVFDAEQLVW